MLLRSYILLRAMPLTAAYFQISVRIRISTTQLLLYAEVRWLSRGKSLRILLLLKDEIEIFLTEQKCEPAVFLQNDLWLSIKLCYLTVKRCQLVSLRKKFAIYLLEMIKLKVLLKRSTFEKVG